MDVLDALDAAAREFGGRLALVPDDGWTLPTPCTAWDVRFLTAHVVGGNRFAVSILEGMPSAEAIDRVMSTPQLGDDPLASWATSADAQRVAFAAGGALDRQVDHPLGPMAGRRFLEFRILDLALHAWDLARAIAADDQLDPALVEAVLGIIELGPPGMGFGLNPLGQALEDAPAQTRLLDLTGRAASPPGDSPGGW